MNEGLLRQRTKRFALATMTLVGSLPKSTTADIIARQLLRSATSVGANYRAACRAKSPADMITKLKIVEEEADESTYWLELLVESGLMAASATDPLSKECNEILAMTVASIKTLRARSVKPPSVTTR